MSRQLDRPQIDKSRGHAEDTGGGPQDSPRRETSGRDPAPWLAQTEAWSLWETRLIIKPSPHQRVAIEVHRQDWP
jgi:hypothetical protein